MRAAAAIVAAVLATGALAQQPGSGMGGMGGGRGQYQESPDFKLPPDPRTVIEVPPHVRDLLRYEMRGHLEQLSTLMARIAEGEFKQAAEFARTGLALMGNHPPGAPRPGMYVTPEFRAMGQAMHQAAEEVARVAGAAATPPTAADWKAVMESVGNLTAACSGCHGSFRVK